MIIFNRVFFVYKRRGGLSPNQDKSIDKAPTPLSPARQVEKCRPATRERHARLRGEGGHDVGRHAVPQLRTPAPGWEGRSHDETGVRDYSSMDGGAGWARLQPDVILLHIGTNDIGQGASLDALVERTRELLRNAGKNMNALEERRRAEVEALQREVARLGALVEASSSGGDEG